MYYVFFLPNFSKYIYKWGNKWFNLNKEKKPTKTVLSEFRINEKFSFARLLVYDWHYRTGFSYTNTIKHVSCQVWGYMLGIPAHGTLRQRTVCWRIAELQRQLQVCLGCTGRPCFKRQNEQIACGFFTIPCTSVLKHKPPFLVRFPDFPKAKFLNYRTRDSLGQLILFWGTFLCHVGWQSQLPWT